MALFTPEELAELAAFDAEVEENFVLTHEECTSSSARDRAARASGAAPRTSTRRQDGLTDYQRYRDQKLAYKRAYAASHKDQIRATAHAYYERNKERIKARNRAYYAKNREKMAAYARAYQQAHKQELSQRAHTRYMLKRYGTLLPDRGCDDAG